MSCLAHMPYICIARTPLIRVDVIPLCIFCYENHVVSPISVCKRKKWHRSRPLVMHLKGSLVTLWGCCPDLNIFDIPHYCFNYCGCIYLGSIRYLTTFRSSGWLDINPLNAKLRLWRILITLIQIWNGLFSLVKNTWRSFNLKSVLSNGGFIRRR